MGQEEDLGSVFRTMGVVLKHHSNRVRPYLPMGRQRAADRVLTILLLSWLFRVSEIEEGGVYVSRGQRAKTRFLKLENAFVNSRMLECKTCK